MLTPLSRTPYSTDLCCVIHQDAMLREFQDEIKALRAQLEATQRGVMIREDGTVRVWAAVL